MVDYVLGLGHASIVTVGTYVFSYFLFTSERQKHGNITIRVAYIVIFIFKQNIENNIINPSNKRKREINVSLIE